MKHALSIKGNLGMFAVLPESGGPHFARLLLRFDPLASVPPDDTNRALFVKRKPQRGGNQESLVFAPIDARFIPGHPQSIL